MSNDPVEMTSAVGLEDPSNPPRAGSYRIDAARTSIAFRAKHMFGAGTIRGRFAAPEGAPVPLAVPLTDCE